MINKKEICITSTQIKQAIDLLVNENEILRDRLYELEEALDKIKEKLEILNEEPYNATTYIMVITEIYKILEDIEWKYW